MNETFTMPVLLWLECLPEEIRNKAIYNCLAQDYEDNLFSDRKSFEEAISSLFVWDFSTEGYKYWSGIATFMQYLEEELNN